MAECSLVSEPSGARRARGTTLAAVLTSGITVLAACGSTPQPAPTARSIDDDLLDVTVAGKTAHAMVEGFEPRKFQLSCTTGDFLFHDIVIRR